MMESTKCEGLNRNTSEGAFSKPATMPVRDRLKGKGALITGAARGIGRAMALRFAQEGANVFIVDVNAPAAEETAHAIEQNGVRAGVAQADVADRSAVEAAVEQAIQAFGGIDILVNNAGIVVFSSMLDCSLDDWDRMLAVDLTGAFHFTQLVSRHMVERGRGGRLLHVGSTASLLPAPHQFAYSIAKSGLRMLSRGAALELARFKITSNLLCPEGAVTDINADLLSDPKIMKVLEDNIPLNRLAEVEEIAAAAAFLVSDEAAYMTGAELVHDGGAVISGLWWR